MSKGFWDRQGANIASHYKEMYGVELFRRLKKRDFGQGITYVSGNVVRSGGDRCLSVEIVSYYCLNVIKSIDKDSFLRKFDCEISCVNLREI